MAIGPGMRLGPYEISALLGAGGMGEVYRALDTKLGRDVAIKVLPEAFTRDSERLARFEREARVLAALNHPHVGSIYGLEEAGGIRALVLELVEGDSLAERIRRGPLAVAEALRIAGQIASALDAAHRKGIIHRDLKPANIKLTPDGAVKVLDFGLAKAADGRAVDVSQSTIAVDGTREGVVVGTAWYMSPEQARGQPVDARTDIWAFGCVLYEMLAGERAFDGRTVSDAIARVLEREPEWSVLPRATPQPIRALLRQCLAKDPYERTPEIATARGVIDLTRVPTEGRSIGRPLLIGGAAIAAVSIVAAIVWLRPESHSPTTSASWEQITDFPDAATQPALSPDGRMVSFIRGAGTLAMPGEVYLKLLPKGETIPLTRDGLTKSDPAFSPDGTRIAYTVTDPSIHRDWNTWVVPVVRGEPRLWLRNALALTWSGPTQLLFSEVKGSTHTGIVTSTESRTQSRELYFPAHQLSRARRSSRSPNGQWVLVVEEGVQGFSCRLLPFDGSSSGRPVGPHSAPCTSAAWSPDGQWMYFAARTGDAHHLWRQRFPDGEPQQMTLGDTEEEGLAIAPDGRSLITSVGKQRRGVWIRDASGERQISREGYAFWPLFSADGQKLCFRIARGAAIGQSPTELWVADLTSDRLERILPGQLVTQYDLSGDRIVAAVPEDDGKSRLWVAWLDGREPPQRLANVEGESPRIGTDGSIFFRGAKDGRPFLFRTSGAGTSIAQVRSEEWGPVAGTPSPENRWLTNGRQGQTYMFAYPIGGGPPVAIFASPVSRLRWSPDGSHVVLSVQVGQASAFGHGRSYVLPVDADSLLPRIPPGGFKTEAELADVPGVQVVPYGDFALSPVAGVTAFSKITVTRNLYRIPLR